MSRVKPYGMGKYMFKIKLSELPKDIQEGIIELQKDYVDHVCKITENTDEVLFCGTIVGRGKKDE